MFRNSCGNRYWISVLYVLWVTATWAAVTTEQVLLKSQQFQKSQWKDSKAPQPAGHTSSTTNAQGINLWQAPSAEPCAGHLHLKCDQYNSYIQTLHLLLVCNFFASMSCQYFNFHKTIVWVFWWHGYISSVNTKYLQQAKKPKKLKISSPNFQKVLFC